MSEPGSEGEDNIILAGLKDLAARTGRGLGDLIEQARENAQKAREIGGDDGDRSADDHLNLVERARKKLTGED